MEYNHYIKVLTKGLLMMTLTLIISLPMYGQRVVTLDECLSMGLSKNGELAIEGQKMIAAKAKRKEVLSHFLPKISINGAYAEIDRRVKVIDWDYLLGDWNFIVPNAVRNFTSLSIGPIQTGSVIAIQPIFLGGKLIEGTRMADAAVRLTSAMSETKQTEVEESIEDTYWKVVSLASKERLVKELVHLLGEARHDVDLAIANGVATRADGLAIRVKQSEAEVKLQQVENGLHLLQMLLAQKCGLQPETLLMPADVLQVDSLSIPRPIKGTVIDTLDISQYVERRSEIRSLRLADTIFTHKMGVERADMLPKVFMIGGYSAISPNPYSAPRNHMQGSWMVGVGFSIPITDILTGAAKVRQARAEREIKRIELDEARKKIRLQMEQALLNRVANKEALNAAQEALAHANENLHYARVGYKEGVIPLLQLTVAQTAWSKAHDAYIDAYIQLRQQESKINHIFAIK